MHLLYSTSATTHHFGITEFQSQHFLSRTKGFLFFGTGANGFYIPTNREWGTVTGDYFKTDIKNINFEFYIWTKSETLSLKQNSQFLGKIASQKTTIPLSFNIVRCWSQPFRLIMLWPKPAGKWNRPLMLSTKYTAPPLHHNVSGPGGATIL